MFDNTRAALQVYDADKPRLLQLFESIDSNEDVYAWEAAEKEALDKVRVAFHLDTKDVNSLSNCMLADVDFMRKGAKLFEGVSNEDARDFDAFLNGSTDDQVLGILEKETLAGRAAYQSMAKLEANRRRLVTVKRTELEVGRPRHWG
jgi:hypothetical protein